MSTYTNNSSATSKLVYLEHATHPERDSHFSAVAASREFLKASQKSFLVRCSQCHIGLEKPLKCAKCKSIWYCSKECQKKNWPTHKPACHEVERSSGPLKFIRMFVLNPVIMGFLKIGVAFDCGLLDDPRVGFDVPFVARVNIAIEPSDILDFVGLYLNPNDKAVGEKQKLQGMVQVNAISPFHPSIEVPYTPQQLYLWREARARCNAEGFAKDPVGLIDFVDGSAENPGHSLTAEVHIPTLILEAARKREPIPCISAITGAETMKPMGTMTCLECINTHIRADKQNQLHLRTEMTEQDKEVIRAARRNEDTLSARILREKMQRERIYADLVQFTD
ncbi:uncharacterized protein EDB91DRAFT_1166863 [Suillus paluster]|uniref:uncharacterized protein n=1 Tax=Suillus paluster TaxID=48578 RepID=UPI001B86AC5F|nr:uncharacterized protein EDB91DRAFT_1166863 [Suillus paluster]KAG1725993.1 hypothetical protein EDB91DRAFT_1166863 [Suillus paluster]